VMRVELHHCLLFVLFIALTHVMVSGATRTNIRVLGGSDDNCTREGGVLICPCNVTINGTYYPCWIPINNATSPNATCNECPKGSFSNNDTVNCTEYGQCPFGTCKENYLCELCSPGQFSNETGAHHCLKCDAGYSSRDPGSENCTACPPGFTTASEGADSCIGCDPGYFSSNYGSPHCDLCDLGLFSLGKASACSRCPKGTFNDRKAQSVCKPCGAGYFGVATGFVSQTQCTKCPAGSYCPDAATVVPVRCPTDSYCLEGVSMFQKCAFLYTADPGMESCQPGSGFYIVIFASVGLAGVFFIVLWRWRVAKRERLQKEYRQTEIDRLIPRPTDGPVYNGF